jgi:uncharacterized protein YbbC (DUF1343 family)
MNDDYELLYLRKVCDIQNKFIKGEVSKEECEQKLEIERLNYIAHLMERNKQLRVEIEREETTRKIISEADKKIEAFYHKG